MSDDGLFQITAANVPFAILPGLVMMFTLAPAAAPSVPFAFTGFFSAFVGAMLGMLVYRQVRAYGPLARIGALTVLLLVLYVGLTVAIG